MERYTTIVVGAGVEGSATAYTLAKEGQRVLLLEQFPLPHSRGSSAGMSRITRYLYDDRDYIRMMRVVYPLWAGLEAEAGETLYTKCGMLDIYSETKPELKAQVRILREMGVDHELLDPQQMRRRFPQVRPGEGVVGVLDPLAGILRADRCIAVFQKLFRQQGGELRDCEKVLAISPGRDVTVTTSKASYSARHVVLAAGPWTKQIGAALGLDLPMNLMRAEVMFWRVKREKQGQHHHSILPLVLDFRARTRPFVYAFPEFEYPGMVKLAQHGGPTVDPDLRDRSGGQEEEAKVKATIEEIFPYLDGDGPVIREAAIYSTTPDYHPYMGTHPKYPNIVVLTGFSGHGFKLAPLVGRLARDLLLGRTPDFDMTRYRLDRFEKKSSL